MVYQPIKNKNYGFTLLEVIVAIAVILIGLVGLLVLVNFTISNSRVSANRLIAANLAQEGIEAVRNTRDSEKKWNQWFAEIDDIYRLDMNLNNREWTLVSDNFPHTRKLRFDQETGFYFYEPSSEGVPTTFSRGITVQSLEDDEKQVISEVRWQEGSKEHSLIIESRLYYWWNPKEAK